ncbi:MAG: ABC transporter ATP-binding protein [Actinobacteria bacterium]|nr:ABC transporter ATP-binding protein [Actinomycetota bacterium]
MTGDTSPVLAARAASRRFGDQTALQPTTLEIREAEVVALLGPNGAGKSTLLALLAGSLTPTSGAVERREGMRIGWTPQRPAHYGRLSPRENLELFAELEGESDPPAAAGRLLAQFELPDSARPSARLSVGNRQRLNLAISLLGNPDVLLLDEPTAALDPPQRRKLWQTAVLHKQRGGAVVFATQNHEELEGHADRVLVLLEGVLAFDGPLEEYERTELARTLV